MRFAAIGFNRAVQNPRHIRRVVAAFVAPRFNGLPTLTETFFYFFCIHGISPISSRDRMLNI
nr:MAG TPA: hypothetical protein [Caudoviricetes sp.]